MDLQLRILSNENFRKTNAVETKFFHTEAVLFKRKKRKKRKKKRCGGVDLQGKLKEDSLL